MGKIKLELTKKQFLELMRLSFIWELAINWQKEEGFDLSAQEFQDFIIEKAVENDIKDYVSYDKEDDSYDYSEEKSDEFYNLLQDYCDEEFWVQIVWIVAKNKILEKYSPSEFDKMSESKKEKLLSDMIDKVDLEFAENDYKNLKLDI